MNRIVSVLFAAAVCLAAAGCASRPAVDDDRTAIPTGSGVTVFGTIDAGVSRYKSN